MSKLNALMWFVVTHLGSLVVHLHFFCVKTNQTMGKNSNSSTDMDQNKQTMGVKMPLILWQHVHFQAVSHILLCRSSQAVLGWMGSVSAQPFSDLFRDVQVQALAGLLKDFQRAVLKPLLCYLGYVLVVLHPVQSLGEGKHQRSIRNWNKAHR